MCDIVFHFDNFTLLQCKTKNQARTIYNATKTCSDMLLDVTIKKIEWKNAQAMLIVLLTQQKVFLERTKIQYKSPLNYLKLVQSLLVLLVST